MTKTTTIKKELVVLTKDAYGKGWYLGIGDEWTRNDWYAVAKTELITLRDLLNKKFPIIDDKTN